MNDINRADWDPVSDEDEVAAKVAGRPNAYWAEVRAKQALDEKQEAGYGGDYRAVPIPHGGPQSVHASDTTGSYDYCWCGLPEGHDWPGKDKGRKHPKAKTTTTRKKAPAPMDTAPEAVEAPHIDRKQLRTFHEDLIDVILRAVNDYGVRYRMRPNGCILYPPDGTRPFTVYARNSEGQVRAVRRWFIAHVVVDDATEAFVKSSDRVLDDMEMKERTRLLAEKVNGPEHEVPKETPDERRTRKDREARERAEKMAAEVAEKQAEIHVRETSEPQEETDWANPPGEWGPYRPKFPSRTKGKNAPEGQFERFANTNRVRCTLCGWEGTTNGMSGHMLNHDAERAAALWGENSQEKKRLTNERKRTEVNVGLAIEHLYKAIGQKPPTGDDTRIKELEKQLALSQDELSKALTAREGAIAMRDEAIKDRDDAKARLDLLREALQA